MTVTQAGRVMADRSECRKRVEKEYRDDLVHSPHILSRAWNTERREHIPMVVFFPGQFHFEMFNQPSVLCLVMCVQRTGKENGHDNAIVKSQSRHRFL
jgi:hypothetical protein